MQITDNKSIYLSKFVHINELLFLQIVEMKFQNTHRKKYIKFNQIWGYTNRDFG